MAINIDSFLDEFDQENTKNKDSKKDKDKNVNKGPKLDLDFQWDTEKKLEKAKELGLNSSEFEILSKIYSQIKTFDEDLLNKFLGIEKEGAQSLSSVSEKYSIKYKEELKKQADLLEQEFKRVKLIIEDNFKKKEFSNLKENLFYLNSLLDKYPNYFYSKKKEFKNELEKYNLKFYQLNKNFIDFDLKELKIKIKKELSNIHKLIQREGNLEKVERSLNVLDEYFSSFDQLFYINLNDENILFSKIKPLIFNYLEKEYRNRFEFIKNHIYLLFDKFHKLYVRVDIRGVVTTYDEILYQFNKLPDYFLEEKIEIYKKVVDLYSSIDDLILKDRINLFLKSYNASKLIEEVRFYLNNAKESKIVNLEVLDNLILKVKELPKEYEYERKILLEKLNTLKSKILQAKQKKILKQSEKETKNVSEKNNENKNYNRGSLNLNSRNNTLNNTNNFQSFSKENSTLLKNSKVNNLNDKNKKLLEEINRLYLYLQKEQDAKKIKLLYKKINFYIDMLNLKLDVKKAMRAKLKKAVVNKKNIQ